MTERADGDAPALGSGKRRPRLRHGLHATRRGLLRSAVKLVGYAACAYLVLRLIPTLRRALSDLERVGWQWVAAALVLETLSEMGFVASWRAILDPDNLLCRDGRMTGTRSAWAQLGGGTLIPAGSFAGVGVGAWIMHSFGMPTKLIAERQFNLSFLNTAVDAIALVIFGLGLATGILFRQARSVADAPPRSAGCDMRRGRAPNSQSPDAPRTAHRAPPSKDRRLADDARERRRGHRAYAPSRRPAARPSWGRRHICGSTCLCCFIALIAVHAHPLPTFAVIVMAYIIGALGGSLPLPAGIGTIGGIVGMLIVFRVAHTPAVAAVVVYQAVGLLVPLVGGAIAYLLLRRQFGPIAAAEASAPPAE